MARDNADFPLDGPTAAPAAQADPAAPAAPTPAARPEIQLTATDVAGIVTVNEARAAQGLPPLAGADGQLTVTEYQARHAAVTATAAAAAAGDTSPAPLQSTGVTPNE